MKTLAVTSGKGGVGKTNLSANLGIQLAQKGFRTLVFDADIGLANLDVVLGVPSAYKLQHVISCEKTLYEVITRGPGGVDFVAGGSGVESLFKMDGPSGEQFLNQLLQLERDYDFLIFDTGAGIDDNVMTFLTAADEVLLVATPDPASLTDAYATAKTLWMRKPDAKIKVVMNMVDNEAQARMVFARVTSISQQFLGRPMEFAGHIRLDTQAISLIRQRKPFSFENPGLPASQDLNRLASTIAGESQKVIHLGGDAPTLADRLRGIFGFSTRKTA